MSIRKTWTPHTLEPHSTNANKTTCARTTSRTAASRSLGEARNTSQTKKGSDRTTKSSVESTIGADPRRRNTRIKGRESQLWTTRKTTAFRGYYRRRKAASSCSRTSITAGSHFNRMSKTLSWRTTPTGTATVPLLHRDQLLLRLLRAPRHGCAGSWVGPPFVEQTPMPLTRSTIYNTTDRHWNNTNRIRPNTRTRNKGTSSTV